MRERAIIHCDINHCYAQIEEMKFPELKKVPMCVGGREEKRHGIVLARNLEAKKYGIKTAETLREATQKCPDLLVIHPSYDDYLYYTERIKDIYKEYTDLVESFGIDEAWLDVTHSQKLFGSAKHIAKTIQDRIFDEMGITISVGISFNKIFAKLGSDLTKPKGFHVIDRENYKSIVWSLPVGELLYVGPKTVPKLAKINILSIGDLANSDLNVLSKLLGKHGELIWAFANGLDTTDVSKDRALVKSVGNGITTPRNIDTFRELKHVFYVLIESVAARLKAQGLKGRVISVSLRSTELKTVSRQMKIQEATNVVSEIMKIVLFILKTKHDLFFPYRSISITVSDLFLDDLTVQTSLFAEIEKEYRIDGIVDDLRTKYGFRIITRASLLLSEDLTDFDPKGSHIIHPVGYFK